MIPFEAKDWPAISALLDQALDLPGSDRSRWLDSLPEHDRRHRPVLLRLLGDLASAVSRQFLDHPARLELPPQDHDAAAIGVDQVGPYRLLRELGRGGMGSVWLAERTDGLLKRKVALKLPHPGLATRAFAERLARERDILASLSHPNIARLYDAGVAQGQPYIALAYVQGKALIEHCRECGMSPRERVVLFLQVLSAVQYAHSHLVIHRDIKPSNVLVDEGGQVHLLDFGIAKLLHEGQAEATALTLDGGLALTPEYASPEQLGGGAIGIGSDVYSLGILLYELLAGVRPYRLIGRTQSALAEAMSEIDIPLPSDSARRSGDAGAAGELRGDLDTVVLKALAKEPEKRYATVDAFGQDLRRWLEGETVLARPATMGYRFVKFVRRHRVGASAALLILLALGAGLAGTTWEARRADQHARRAETVQAFLVSLFNEADPVRAQGRELTAREMLDRGLRDLPVQLRDQPELQATLGSVLVDLYLKLGDEKKALPLAEVQVDRALRRDGPDSVAYGDALYALAHVHGGLVHHAVALDLYRKAHQVLAQHAKERASELLVIEGREAVHLVMLDRTQEAVDLLTGLVPRLTSHFGASGWETLRQQSLLAGAYGELGEHGKVADIVAEVSAALDRSDAPHSLDAAELRINLGYAAWKAGSFRSGQALLETGIADADQLLGAANTMSVEAQRTLGTLFQSMGRFDNAVATFGDSVQRARQLGGEDSAATRFAESFSVTGLIMTGRPQEALDRALSSVRRPERVEGLSAAMARGFDRRLGLAYLAAGDYREGARVLESVLSREEAAGVRTGSAHATTLLYLAGTRAAEGRQAEAAAEAELAAVAFADGHAPPAEQARAKLTGALALARLGRTQAAQSLVAAAQALLATQRQQSESDPLFVELVQAEILRSQGAVADAERTERSARERLRAFAGTVPAEPLLVIF